jgi:DNA repair exonuclease SbcCD ATPase subunit
MIDKMLGLYNLRTLVEALPLASVDREIKVLEKHQVETAQTKNDIERLLKESKTAVDRLAKDLEDGKVPPDTVSLVSLAQTLVDTDGKITETANLLGLKTKSIESPKTIEEARNIPDLLNKNLTQVENTRTEIYGKLMQDLQAANQFYDGYKSLLDEKEKLNLDPEKIAKEKQETISSLSELKKETEGLQSKYIEIKTEEPIARRIVAEKKQYEDTINEITQKYGTKPELSARIEELGSKVTTFSGLINQQDILSKIVNLGIQYIQMPEVDTCPICESKVAKDQLQASLSQRIKEKKEAKLIEKLTKDIKELNQQKEENQKALNGLDEASLKYERTTKETDERKKKLETLGLAVEGIETPEQLLSYLQAQNKAVEKELQGIKQKNDTLATKKTELEAAERKIEDLTKTEVKIQKLLSVQLKGTDLLNKLGEYASAINSRTQEITKLGDKANALRENINIVKTMVDYLIKKKEAENTEKSILPGVQNKLELLNRKLSEAQELGAALHDIHDAAISAQEEFLQATLGPLQNDINEFYSKLIPHPNFDRLELQPEMQRGKYIYRVKGLSRNGTEWTYVQTSFSLAQMNLTAISIFFAMAVKDPRGFIILDDPSQSLDPQHKKALASLIAEIGTQEQVIVATQDEQFLLDLQRETKKINPAILNFGKWDRNGPVLNQSQ